MRDEEDGGHRLLYVRDHGCHNYSRWWFPPFLISVICDRELVLSQRERERLVARSIFICLGGVDKDSVRVTQLQSLGKECEV